MINNRTKKREIPQQNDINATKKLSSFSFFFVLFIQFELHEIYKIEFSAAKTVKTKEKNEDFILRYCFVFAFVQAMKCG